MSFDSIVVGDAHATVDSLEDCRSLIQFIKVKAKEKDTRNIFFLGDLFHTHSTINSYVMDFWKESFDDLLLNDYFVYVIPGNHDSSGAGLDNAPHALRAFVGYNDNLMILEEPTQIFPNVWAIRHYYDPSKFLEAVDKIKEPSSILNHNTMDGSKYENGFYAKDGIDVSSYKHTFISGHVHMPSEWGNVKNFGSPRWLTANDANQDRFIWYAEIDGPNIKTLEKFSTRSVVTSIYQFDDTQDVELDFSKSNLIFKSKMFINIKGSPAFINKRLAYYNKLKQDQDVKAIFSLRTFPIKESINEVKESEGISKAFQKYFINYECKFGTDKKRLFDLVSERAEWLLK